MMNTNQIKNVIQQDLTTRKKFAGVFAENRLPQQIDFYPCGFIVNSDPDSKPGRHWLALYFTSPEQGEFFDSFGRKPEFYSKKFVTFLNRNSKNWTHSQRELQSVTTAVCGEYCIFYLMHRARNVSMNSIVNLFSLNKQKNDQQVYEFVIRFL